MLTITKKALEGYRKLCNDRNNRRNFSEWIEIDLRVLLSYSRVIGKQMLETLARFRMKGEKHKVTKKQHYVPRA